MPIAALFRHPVGRSLFRGKRLALAAAVLAGCAASLAAVRADEATATIRLGEPTVQQWRIGYMITAQGGELVGATAYATTPMDWPEQRVRVVAEDVSPQVQSIRYRTIGGGAKQMVISIPRLATGESARAVVTFEIEKSPIEAPLDPAELRIPARASGELRLFLAPGPAIESNHREIQSLAKEIGGADLPAWEQVGALFDWVRANVVYEFDEQQRGALAALRAGKGDCEELTALFVALCRNRGVPARSVWVPGHCYPEFYLEDAAGRGRWFPCQAAGAKRDFGRISESRPILQKGDNFRPPGERKPQHYVHEKFEARHAAAPPKVQFIREPVSPQG